MINMATIPSESILCGLYEETRQVCVSCSYGNRAPDITVVTDARAVSLLMIKGRREGSDSPIPWDRHDHTFRF